MIRIPNQTKFAISDGEHEYIMKIAINENGWLCPEFYSQDGVLAGTPIRFKQGGAGRIAADFPSVDPNHFIVDENGKITNG